MDEDTTTEKVLTIIQSNSFQLGIYKQIMSDGGPKFKADNMILIEALKKLGCFHQLASANKPSLNGCSEAGVKEI